MIRRRPTVTALLRDLLVTLPLLLSWPAGAQDAAPADRNAINTRAHPGGMMADSPVTFPKEGALPAKYPPDVHVQDEPAEKDYYIFSSPCRSLAQIVEIQAAMPKGQFTPPAPDWRPLRRTRQILAEGGELRLLALGDSIVNDTMRSGWVARLAEAYPKARIQTTVYVRGGGGCQHYKELNRIATNVTPRRPNLVFIGGISQRDPESIPIKAPTNVVDEALFAAHQRLSMMLSNLPSVRASLRVAGAELHIIGRDQVTTDLPEWRQDKGKPLAEYNGLTRDERTRGMGGLLTSCGEENLLKLQKDRYRGRDICVHEFAHNILGYGVSGTFRETVRQQYRRSLDHGLWVESYAGSNYDEFFAELTMWYFGTHGDLHMRGAKPAVGREGLKAYDPEAFTLLDDFYSGRMKPSQP